MVWAGGGYMNLGFFLFLLLLEGTLDDQGERGA